METYFSEFANARMTSNSWKKNTFGRSSFRSSEACSPCMTSGSCIETWRAQIFSYTRIRLLNSAISMFQKLPKKVFYIPRLGHLIMPVQKYGRISLTIWSPTSGHLDVWFTKCAHWFLLSVLKIWMAFLRESLRVSTHPFPATTLWTCDSWSKRCCM